MVTLATCIALDLTLSALVLRLAVPGVKQAASVSDDLVALTTVLALWNSHMTPQMRNRARRRLDRWIPHSR